MTLSPGTDNVIAALGQRNRVYGVALHLAGWQLEEVLAPMQVSFPNMTSLRLHSHDETPVIPDSFLGGSSPRLQILHLDSISFPGLPKLLLSATQLVSLYLSNIPHFGHLSPKAMVALLSVLSNLKTLHLQFRSPQSRPNWESRSLPPPTRSILPTLDEFHFKGVTEYLEDFVTCIDTPQLDQMHITFFNQIDFDCPRLAQFINSTPTLRALDEAYVQFVDTGAGVTLRYRTSKFGFDDLRINIPCREPDWQLSSIEQVCNSSLHPLSIVEDLYIDHRYSQLVWKDDAIENTLWLELLLPFTAVKDLYLSKEFAPAIAAALQELVGARLTEVLPTLQNIFVEGLELSGPFRENIHVHDNEQQEDQSPAHSPPRFPSDLPPSHSRVDPPSVPFPTASPASSVNPAKSSSTPIQHSPSSTGVILSNGRPLKSSLKSASSPSTVATSSARHTRTPSMPSTPVYGPKNIHFKEMDEGLESVRLFRRTGKPVSVSKPTSDTETNSETEPSGFPFPNASLLTEASSVNPAKSSSTPMQRTPSSTSVILSNGRPLKSSLKSASSPSTVDYMAASSARHTRTPSMPSTPVYGPKNIHFKGKDEGLESVRLFRRTGKPVSVSKPSSDTETDSETEPSGFPFPNASLLTEIATCSPIPAPDPSPYANVHLESVSLPPARPPVLRGTVLVRNIVFEKHVCVRFTIDDWMTASEVLAKYSGPVASLEMLAGTNQGKTVSDLIGSTATRWDRFNFAIKLEDYETYLWQRTLYLVTRYTAPGVGEFWDNNSGENYRITFRPVRSVSAPSITPFLLQLLGRPITISVWDKTPT